MHTSIRSALVLALVLAACGGSAATTSTTAPTTTTRPPVTTTTVPTEPPAGEVFGHITDVTLAEDGAVTITVDPAVFLTGEDATAAAREAGVIGADETVPNDYFIVDDEDAVSSYAVVDGAAVTVQACFADGACVTESEVTVRQWVDMWAGRPVVDLDEGFQWYGAGQLPYWLTVDGGVVIGVREQYLP